MATGDPYLYANYYGSTVETNRILERIAYALEAIAKEMTKDAVSASGKKDGTVGFNVPGNGG